MARSHVATTAGLGAFAIVLALHAPVSAVSCGDGPAGFEAWKRAFAEEAAANGIEAAGIAALMKTRYSRATIGADRNQKNHKLSLDAFMAKRGAASIIKRGQKLKQSKRALFASIEETYGVPPGPLLAIWGMETGFGRSSGKQDVLSAVATLAYDCRRPELFTDQLHAALTLIDQGTLSPRARGAMHGEVGHTQFLPTNILLYGVDGDGDGRVNLDTVADALASTANFLEGHGWVAGEGYQPGETNFAALQGWNSASVYQQAIAIVAGQIDGDDVAAR